MTHAAPTRRSFLAASAAAWSSAALCQGAGAKEPLPLTLGIQLYSLRGFPVDQALDHAKALGLTQVEFYSGMFPITDDAEAIAAMKQKVADRGLTISAHGVNRFTKDVAANRKLFEFAKAAGTKTITADPDPDSFASLDELVKEFDIRVAIHNHGPRHRYNKALDVLDAIEKHDERIGACADLGHFIRSGSGPRR
jgi:sugar phosphate isomerase/epimerase